VGCTIPKNYLSTIGLLFLRNKKNDVCAKTKDVFKRLKICRKKATSFDLTHLTKKFRIVLSRKEKKGMPK
jgi:hypothetical protein